MDPTLAKPTRIPVREPKNLTLDEIELFLNSLNPELITELRMRTLCEFLMSTLLRISEALSVNVSDINWEKSEISVVGKGDKQHTVYLKDRTIEWIKRYLARRKDSNPALFVTTGSNPKRLKSHDQSKIFKVYAKRVPSITQAITPHALRRSAATILSANGAPLKDIQTLLAHSDVSTTLRHYIAADKEQVRQSHGTYLRY